MFDLAIQTLTDMRYVPKLRKTLISLGYLDTDDVELSYQRKFSRSIRGRH